MRIEPLNKWPKMQNFIFKDEEYKFTFYSLDSIKGTGKFIFDIPPCPTCI